MHFVKSYSVLALLQAAAMAVAVAPKCNADNCLRGLFGSNAKASSANMAACSTGLPTVTVSVDGTTRTTMTGAAALPAAATVCDGQGVDKRAARFQSACSCVGVFPSTVTQTATQPTTTAAQTTTQAAPQPEVTLGQVADAATLFNKMCSGDGFEWAQSSSSTADASVPSYRVPRNGLIVSATTFDLATRDGGISQMALEIWRPTASTSNYVLVGNSDVLTMLGTGSVVSFVLQQPIPVQAGDLLGLFAGNNRQASPCLTMLSDQTSAVVVSIALDGISPVNSQRSFLSPYTGYRLNVAAVLQ